MSLELWDDEYVDDDFDDDLYSDLYDRDDDSCCLGDACLNPSYDHTADECYDVAMCEQMAEEAASA